MDFFQGSSPLKFIPFRLANQINEDVMTPANPLVIDPVETLLPPGGSRCQTQDPSESQTQQPQSQRR